MTSILHLILKMPCLLISDENIGELFQQMNKKLKNVSTWFKANKLYININKTK